MICKKHGLYKCTLDKQQFFIYQKQGKNKYTSSMYPEVSTNISDIYLYLESNQSDYAAYYIHLKSGNIVCILDYYVRKLETKNNDRKI